MEQKPAASLRTLARVGNRELIFSGAIMARGEEPIVIFPFEEAPDYQLVIKHGLKSDGETETLVYIDDGERVVVEITYSSIVGVNTVNTDGIIIAVDDVNKYHFAYSFEIVGKVSKYAVFLTYSIYRASIND